MAAETANAPAPTGWLNDELLEATPESRDQLEEIVTEVGRSPALWDHAVSFDPDRWTRRVLYRTPHLEVLLFGWAAGQATVLHDHGGASGAAFVRSGTLIEDRAEAAGGGRFKQRTDTWAAGSAFSFGPEDVHRVKHDPRHGPAISIHAYTRSTSEPRDYELLPDGTLRVLGPDRQLQLA